MNYKKYTGFTLVELIIVITILAILTTIAFVSFQNYTKDARDSNRLTHLKNMEKGLEAFHLKTGDYPDSENSLAILASGSKIAYQGYFGEIISKLTNHSKTPLDPLDGTKYIYSTNYHKTKFQLLGFLEGNPKTAYIENTIASDYSKRIPKAFGNSLGIFLNLDNSPLSGSGLDIIKTNDTYKSILNNSLNGVIVGTGGSLSLINPQYSCKRLLELGYTQNGIYEINPYGGPLLKVYCDMQTDGGGRTRLNNNLVNEVSGTGFTLGINFGENDILIGPNNYRGCPQTGTYNFKINGIKINNISSLRFDLERTSTILQCSKLSKEVMSTPTLGDTIQVGFIDNQNNLHSWGNTCQWYHHDNNSKWDTGHGEKLNNTAYKKWRWIYSYTGSTDIYYTTGCSGPNDNGNFQAHLYVK